MLSHIYLVIPSQNKSATLKPPILPQPQPHPLNQILIKPSNSLQESLFLGKLLNRLAHITSNRETVRNTTEKVYLIYSLDFLEDIFCLVAFFCWEDIIGFGGCDGEGSFDGADFFFIDETWGVLVTIFVFGS